MYGTHFEITFDQCDVGPKDRWIIIAFEKRIYVSVQNKIYDG